MSSLFSKSFNSTQTRFSLSYCTCSDRVARSSRQIETGSSFPKRGISESAHLLSRTSQAFRLQAASDPALAWAIDATSNPYFVCQQAPGFLWQGLVAALAFKLASEVVNVILWDYKERKSDDPNRVHDISLDLDKLGQDNGGEGSSGATHVLALPTLEPAAKSDTELLMDELIRLGVGGNIFATLNKFEFDGEGVKNGLVVFYELFVWGMQRRVMTTATAAIVIALGAQQKVPFPMAADLLERSLKAPKTQWTGELASTLVDGEMMEFCSVYGLMHLGRSRELVALCEGRLSPAQAYDAFKKVMSVYIDTSEDIEDMD